MNRLKMYVILKIRIPVPVVSIPFRVSNVVVDATVGWQWMYLFFLDQCHPKPNLHWDPGHNELKKTTSSGRNDGISVAFSMGILPKWIKMAFTNRLARQKKVRPDLCNFPSKPQPCDQQNVGARLPMELSWISWRMWRQNLQSICSKKQHPRIPPHVTWKVTISKGKFIFQPAIFHGRTVSFRRSVGPFVLWHESYPGTLNNHFLMDVW